MRRGRKAKDPYEGLSGEWRAVVDGGTDEEVKAKLAETAIESQAILNDMVADTDYQAAKSALKVAGEGYRERRKIVKLKQKFATNVLKSRGKL